MKARSPWLPQTPSVELVRPIAAALVNDVDAVQITELSGQMTNALELKVAKSDVGKQIGRQGRAADAIRTLMNCSGTKLSKRNILKIVDQ